MYKRHRFLTLAIVSLLSSNLVFSQEVRITEVKKAGPDFEIHYNLLDDRTERSYSIQLYTSLDNFIQPMQMVHGDAGIDISVGENKVLTWNAMEELGGDFDGALSLELKGNLYVPFVSIDGLEEGMIFKRTKPFDLIWSGGRGDNVLNFELYQGENAIMSFEERPNVGNTTMVIPSSVKPGEGYRFRISDTRNKDEIVFTNSFSVQRKVPQGVKIGAAFLVGVAAALIYQQTRPTPDLETPPPPPEQ